MFGVQCSMFAFPEGREQLSSNPQSTTPHAERMNTNTEHCLRLCQLGLRRFSPSSLALAPRSTSNAQRRTEEANITARTAHLSLLLLFGSTLEVQRWMFDVRLSSGPLAALFQSKIASGHASLGFANFLQAR